MGRQAVIMNNLVTVMLVLQGETGNKANDGVCWRAGVL